jgi:uncharacterized protein (DUF2141 family)
MIRVSLFFSLIFIQTLICAQTRIYKSSDIANNDVSSIVGKGGGVNDNKERYTITITVTNIRSTEGVIRFKFYDDSTPFPDDNGFLKIVVPKTQMKGDSLTLTYYGFTPKHMAIALLDDENNNVKLDFGMLLPKEGHAFSNYFHTAWRRPVYDDFSFALTGNKKVVMKMKYY